MEKGREGSSVRDKPGHSGAGVLFPFLESPELALNGKCSLLCLWCRQIDVNLLLLLSLLGIASLPFFLWARSLVGCWGCFCVKLAHRGSRTGYTGEARGPRGCMDSSRELRAPRVRPQLGRGRELVHTAAAFLLAPAGLRAQLPA